MFSGGLEAKVNDFALRQHLKIMGVSNFSLGSNFILGRLIYNLVIKFKTHKYCNCQQSVYLTCKLLCMFGCVYILNKQCNSLMPHSPKGHHQRFVCTVLSLSLVIYFYKYSISLTSSQTQVSIKQSHVRYIIYFCALVRIIFLVQLSCLFFLYFTFPNISRGKIEAISNVCFSL